MQDKLTAIAENSVSLHERCYLNHYVTTVIGDGTSALQFSVPFEPDMVQVLCTDPRIRLKANTVMSCAFDLRAFGFASAVHTVINTSGSFTSGGCSNSSLSNYYERSDDGVVTIHELRGISGNSVFATGFQYQISAVRYTGKTDKQRITEFVEGLTGTGTAEICMAKVNKVITNEEWTALIATKPDWTFVEV